MDRDGLTQVINNISNYETLKELLLNSTIEEDIKSYLIELFNKFNFNNFEIFFESIEDEITLVFFPNKNNDDSGKLTFYIKKDHYKIYIYGCKFAFDKEEFKIKSRLALDGEYFVKEIIWIIRFDLCH
ncbi:hypothetical protein [Aquimarina algiphila]|uniref:Uncharacterized protein n=1 Tax=Aquimarina algiphila TaxID=2047982 RepID=A0A554V8P6_9FLAO|nr:hypothetical protein [Aquimarina algiphila]TSE01760.1 hypothetical protein FOF46_31040 [Aquimarina algiphila]